MKDQDSFAKHRKEQILRWAFQSTPEERLNFVESSLEFIRDAGIDYHLVKRELQNKSKGTPVK